LIGRMDMTMTLALPRALSNLWLVVTLNKAAERPRKKAQR
jgi:hypothetical protein